MRNYRIALLAVTILACASNCPAEFIFDVVSIENIDTPNGTATGTSNGVGWTLSPTSIWSVLTYTNQDYTGYSDPLKHNPPIDTTDTLHISARTFDLQFDQPIASALVYITDNLPLPTDGQLDFGITPTYVSGDISINGTAFKCESTDGGLVLLENINSNLLSHVTPGEGSLTFAISVTPVPEPAGLALLASLILGVTCSYRRKRA